jgi:transcriptional regulator with XRE-family HTH domain
MPGFGEVLRGHRRAARLTLEQLAEVSGVSVRTLSDMERGRSKGPQQRTVTALADALALEEDARKQFVELARDGRLRDHWARPAGAGELPRLVGDFTGRAAEARRMFRRLAVVPGRDFDAELAAVAGGMADGDAWDALDELVDLGLLLDGGAGRYRFHDLVRFFARARLEEEEPAAARAEVTLRVTSWLARERAD